MKRYLINIFSILFFFLIISCNLFNSLKKENSKNKKEELLNKKLSSLPLIGVQEKKDGSFKYEYSSYDFNSAGKWNFYFNKYTNSGNIQFVILNENNDTEIKSSTYNESLITINKNELHNFKKVMKNGGSFKEMILTKNLEEKEIKIKVIKGEGDSSGFIFLNRKIQKIELDNYNSTKIKDLGEFSFIVNTLKFEERIKREEKIFKEYEKRLKEDAVKNKQHREIEEEDNKNKKEQEWIIIEDKY